MKALVFALLVGTAAALAFSDKKLRIYNGETASDGQFPYQISLWHYGKEHRCGGAILDETTVICDARCVYGFSPSEFTVVAGITKQNQTGDIYQVKKYISHKDYNSWSMINDISIIKLEKPIKFNDKIQPIEIRTDNIGAGEECTFSGWGYIDYNEGGTKPNDLIFTKLKTINFDECKEKIDNIGESELCANAGIGVTTCYGDFGGPLVDSDGKLIGISAWIEPCQTKVPDVFVRISSYLDWIEENRH